MGTKFQPIDTNDLWCVVCQDLDAAIGPFWEKDTAVAVALALSEKGGCIYLPIPFKLMGIPLLPVEVTDDKTGDTISGDTYSFGQYL